MEGSNKPTSGRNILVTPPITPINKSKPRELKISQKLKNTVKARKEAEAKAAESKEESKEEHEFKVDDESKEEHEFKVADDQLNEVINSGIKEETIQELQLKFKQCQESCKQIEAQLRQIESDTILPFELSRNDTLIDLLEKTILAPHHNWSQDIEALITIPNSVKGQGRLRGGDYFEALFQLAIAINILPQFKGKFIRFYDIKDYTSLNPFDNYLYKKSILNSGKSETGIADISFEVSENSKFENKLDTTYECGSKPKEQSSKNPFYFITVKGFRKEKSIAKDYDIPILDQQISEFPELNKHIFVCVKNSEQFKKKVSRSKMMFLKNSINYIVGYDDLIKAFTEFRIIFFNKLNQSERSSQSSISSKVRELFPNSEQQLPILSLYFHQELVVKSVINRITEMSTVTRSRPHFLCIGVLPRGGKSFIAGGIIDLHRKSINSLDTGYNVLFLTSAINETREQFREDLIERFSEFSDFNFIDVVLTSKGDTITGTTKTKKNNFFFVSRQLSSIKEEQSEEEVEAKKDPSVDLIRRLETRLGGKPIPFNICFFDEAHVGISSASVKMNFQKTFDKYKIPIILMTATYKGPARMLDSDKDLFVWDLQDINDMKQLPDLKLQGFIEKSPDVLERYPEVAKSILQQRLELGQSLEQIAKPYLQFPNPNFISLTFTDDTISSLFKTGEGYSYQRFFEYNLNPELLKDNTQYSNWHSMLANKEHALYLREYMTPELDEKDKILIGNNRRYRALNQIFSIAQSHGGRPMQSKPFSILMFLPFQFGTGLPVRIGEICRIWASFLHELSYWKNNFVFLTLSTYSDHVRQADMTPQRAVERGLCHREDFDLPLKKLILTIEREALKVGKGLVLLSGDVAKMGISLPCVDVVFMMSNNTDADDIIQKMYRALTDNPPLKKDGFIVDLDIKRIITAMFDYDREKDKLRVHTKTTPSTEQRLTKLFELCNWGQDAFIEDKSNENFNTIMETIKQKVISDLKTKMLTEYSEKKLKQEQIHFIRSDPTLSTEMDSMLQYTFVKKSKLTKKQKQVLLEKGATILGTASSTQQKQQGSEEGGESQTEQVNEGENLAVGQNQPTVPKPLREVVPLTKEEIDEKTMNILKTFINTLVIKSADTWPDHIDLAKLLTKYKEDKAKITDPTSISCICTTNMNCKKQHTNLYELAYCELKSYAMVAVSMTSGQYQYTDKVDYNSTIHNKIMLFIEDVFIRSNVLVEWNNYIDKLLTEIHESKRVQPTSPYLGGHRFTRKKYKGIVRNGF